MAKVLLNPKIRPFLKTLSHHRYLSIRSTKRPHYKSKEPPPPPSPPPTPPKAPRKQETFTLHDTSWEDPYSWMSKLHDKVSMRHMDVCMEQEEKYTESVMSDTEKLQSKLQTEMASRMFSNLSTPALKWGPWLYYRRLEEGKQYPVLCRRSAALHEEFISNKSPSAGFDFTSGKRIEQKLIDYNEEAERFGGYAYEELSEVSPNHRFLAHTMYDKDNDHFKLSVKDLNSGSLCSKPQADQVSNLAWARDGKTLFYAVRDSNNRPYRIYCSVMGSNEDDVLLLEEPDENVIVKIRHTKDFCYVSVNTFSPTFSKVFLINADAPLSGMKLIWESGAQSHCIVEHHQGYLYLFTDAATGGEPLDNYSLLRCPVNASFHSANWQNVFIDDQDLTIHDVDFCDTHLVLIVSKGRKFKLCSVPLPMPVTKEAFYLKDLSAHYLPLPKHVSQILPGPNYDYYSSTMRFTVLSPVMPDAVVDYDLSGGKWSIIQQQNMLHERKRILYGIASSSRNVNEHSSISNMSSSLNANNVDDDQLWNDLSEFYACERYDVSSYDGGLVPLTLVYSRKSKTANERPGLLHGNGAFGEILDKRWRNDLKSLLDRGWVIAYADVRGGGGGGKRWHHDGRRTKKHNSIEDFISCAKFLIKEEIVHENKLAGLGYSAGGLLVASAINVYPDLFRAAVLEDPFLDPSNTLLYPILPLSPVDYEEFGYPEDIEDFQAIQKYSPYDNIQKDVLYPGVLVTSSFNTRFGIWEAAKWVARVRERTIYDPKRPILLNLITDIVEDSRYLQCRESALAAAFLIKMMDS